MAGKFEKFQPAEKQYGLRATSPVSPGEVLYVAEPYAYTIKKSAWGRVCEFCLNSSDHLLLCSQCKFAKYCGKQCQTAAWQDHKRECKCIRNHTSSLETDPVRLVGKIIFKMLRKSPCPSEELCCVSELEPKLIRQNRESKEEFEWLTEMLLIYLKEEIPDRSHLPVNINLPELFSVVARERWTINNGEFVAVAVGFYPAMYLVKYSCEPNCTPTSMGRQLHLRAIRNIEVGEELTVAVVDPLMPTSERQTLLRNQYCFNCACRRCQTNDKDENMLAGDKEASAKTECTVKKVLELQSHNQWVECLALCRAQLQSNVGRVPDQNIHQLKLLDYAMDACNLLHLHNEALQYGYRTLEPYRFYLTGISAMRSVQLIKIAMILTQQGKMNQVLSMFKEAIGDLKVFFGENHPMTKKISWIVETCNGAENRGAAGPHISGLHSGQWPCLIS